MNYVELESILKKMSKKQLLEFIDKYDSHVLRRIHDGDNPLNIVLFYEQYYLNKEEW